MCFNTFRGRARCARTAIGVIALLAVGASNASAQQTAVCSAMPGTGERIECTKAADSSDDIDLTLKGIDIDTTGDEAHGVYGHHEGTGKVFVAIQTGFDEGGGLIRNYIDTRGDDAHGVYGRHVGRGNIFLGGQNLHVTTAGSSSNGITGYLGYRQATPESPDPPPEAAGLIDIGVSDSTIEVTGNYSHGIFAEHYGGEGQLRIDVRRSTINVLSDGDFGGGGIYGLRRGTATGDATVTVSNTNITTTGRGGIDVDHAGEDTANLTIDVDRGRITTAGRNGFAVRGYRHRGTGNVDIDVVGTVINTTGTSARGIYGYMYTNDGNIDVYAENIDFTSTGERGDGILTWFQKRSTEEAGDVLGDVLVDVRGGSITTKGVFAVGLYNRHEGTGLLDIDVRNLDIKTESTGIYRDVGTLSQGIFGQHLGDGDIDIDVLGGSIDTKGTFSYGIYGQHRGTGSLAIDTRDGHTITTTGDNAHGIVAYHFGTEDSRSMAVTVGGSVEASGAGAHGVRVGIVNADGEAERVAGFEAGYRQQTVTVDGRVYGGSGEGAGVFLAGGGRVYIGPAGTVGAESGIAIRASGGAPKLYLDMNLDGRRVAEVIGDDWIINDGGETTIVVNSVMLHDGATGSTGLVAANGAWDVMVRDEGVTVDTSTTPWTITGPAAGVVADRDFSADDFDESETGDPDPDPDPDPEPDPTLILNPRART